MIKEALDRRYGGPWHVVVGKAFAFEVTHEVGMVMAGRCCALAMPHCSVPPAHHTWAGPLLKANSLPVCSASTTCTCTWEAQLEYWCGSFERQKALAPESGDGAMRRGYRSRRIEVLHCGRTWVQPQPHWNRQRKTRWRIMRQDIDQRCRCGRQRVRLLVPQTAHAALARCSLPAGVGVCKADTLPAARGRGSWRVGGGGLPQVGRGHGGHRGCGHGGRGRRDAGARTLAAQRQASVARVRHVQAWAAGQGRGGEHRPAGWQERAGQQNGAGLRAAQVQASEKACRICQAAVCAVSAPPTRVEQAAKRPRQGGADDDGVPQRLGALQVCLGPAAAASAARVPRVKAQVLCQPANDGGAARSHRACPMKRKKAYILQLHSLSANLG